MGAPRPILQRGLFALRKTLPILHCHLPAKPKLFSIRPNKNGGIDIGVHDGERLIAKLPGKTYGVYECAPGESMFFPAALGIWTSLMPS